MNSDTLQGQGRNVGGQIKEAIGNAAGDPELQDRGVADQVSGTVQNGYGKVRDFAKARPFTFAAVAGVIGIAILNTLRGK